MGHLGHGSVAAPAPPAAGVANGFSPEKTCPSARFPANTGLRLRIPILDRSAESASVKGLRVSRQKLASVLRTHWATRLCTRCLFRLEYYCHLPMGQDTSIWPENAQEYPTYWRPVRKGRDHPKQARFGFLDLCPIPWLDVFSSFPSPSGASYRQSESCSTAPVIIGGLGTPLNYLQRCAILNCRTICAHGIFFPGFTEDCG